MVLKLKFNETSAELTSLTKPNKGDRNDVLEMCVLCWAPTLISFITTLKKRLVVAKVTQINTQTASFGIKPGSDRK